MRRLLVLTWFALVLGSAGCSSREADRAAIRQVLNVRTQALNSRDLPLYLTTVSAQFKSGDKDYQRLQAELASGFKRFGRLSYRTDLVRIRFSGQKALVDTRYELRVDAGGRETVLNGEEHLALAREPAGWKIIAGL